MIFSPQSSAWTGPLDVVPTSACGPYYEIGIRRVGLWVTPGPFMASYDADATGIRPYFNGHIGRLAKGLLHCLDRVVGLHFLDLLEQAVTEIQKAKSLHTPTTLSAVQSAGGSPTLTLVCRAMAALGRS